MSKARRLIELLDNDELEAQKAAKEAEEKERKELEAKCDVLCKERDKLKSQIKKEFPPEETRDSENRVMYRHVDHPDHLSHDDPAYLKLQDKLDDLNKEIEEIGER